MARSPEYGKSRERVEALLDDDTQKEWSANDVAANLNICLDTARMALYGMYYTHHADRRLVQHGRCRYAMFHSTRESL